MTKLDEDEAAARSKSTSLLDLWNSNKLAMTLVGVGAVAAVGFAAKIMAEAAKGGGDEPPIRVKGGSIYLDLISDSNTWEYDGKADVWHIFGNPPRSKDDLVLFIDYTTGAPRFLHAEKLGIFHKDDTGKIVELEIKSTGKSIRVKRKDQGTKKLQSDKQSLYYDQGGALHCLTVDGLQLNDSRSVQSVLILDL